MLVLSRKLNESIIIADNITITVVDIRGDKVRLGIEAPKSIPIRRAEILERIQKAEPVSADMKPSKEPESRGV